ncbi:hypothetical protein D3C72_2290200 [compost metagenome]
MNRYNDDACPLAFSARRPIQLLATEWAAKKPKVNSSRPATISGRALNRVSSRPPSISRITVHSTLRRPSRSASEPTQAEL